MVCGFTLVALLRVKGDAMDEEKTCEFYKKFHDDNRVALLQYASLREHFNVLVEDVLGENYYNMGMDVYSCDAICCEDIARRAKSFWVRLFKNKLA